MSKQRAKGTRWATRVENYLAMEGIRPRRQPLYGENDRGDIHVGPLDGPVVIECKDQARHSLAEWLDEANTEVQNAGGVIGVAWFHRRGKASSADGYVLMDGRSFAYLLREAGLT